MIVLGVCVCKYLSICIRCFVIKFIDKMHSSISIEHMVAMLVYANIVPATVKPHPQ